MPRRGAQQLQGSSPFFHVLSEEAHVFLPEVADDLCDCQYAARIELGGAWGGSTLPQEKQRMGTIILYVDDGYAVIGRRSRRGSRVSEVVSGTFNVVLLVLGHVKESCPRALRH